MPSTYSGGPLATNNQKGVENPVPKSDSSPLYGGSESKEAK